MPTSKPTSSGPIRNISTPTMALFTQVNENSHNVLVLNKQTLEGAFAENQQGSETSEVARTIDQGLRKVGLI